MKYLKYALGLLAVLMLVMTGPRFASAESCVTSCLGKGVECLQQCLNPNETAHTVQSSRIEPAKSDGTIMLACVQPPSSCSSNSDCTCSNCCTKFGPVYVCQPSC